MSRRTLCFLALGAVSGALAALSTLYPLGAVVAPRLFGVCFGIIGSTACSGIDRAFYLFPGLIFGVLFAAAELWRGRFDIGRAIIFAIASGLGNALATLVCIGLFGALGEALNIDLVELLLAFAGAVGGAAGSAAVVGALRLLARGGRPIAPIITGAALGVLTPLLIDFDIPGDFAFYIVWQAGFAATLARSPAQP